MAGTTVPKGSDFVVVGLGKTEAVIGGLLLGVAALYLLWRARRGGY